MGAVDYWVKKRPKVVLFYAMRLTHEAPFQPNAEVSAMEWVEPETAAAALSHELERDIVRRWLSGAPAYS